MSKKLTPNTVARLGNGCPSCLSGSLIVTRGEVYEEGEEKFINIKFLNMKDEIRAFRGGKGEVENVNVKFLLPDIAKTMKYRRNPTKEFMRLKKLRKEELEQTTDEVQAKKE